MHSYGTRLRNAQLDLLSVMLGPAPVARLYGGPVPATARDPLGSAVLLAEGALPAGTFGAAEDGVKRSLGPWTLTGKAGGEAAFLRLYGEVGECHWQGDIGGPGAAAVISSTLIAAGQQVLVTRFQLERGN